MAEVRWTTQAADDLEAITEYIAGDSPHYASLFAMDVLAAVDRLEDFPQAGRRIPEGGDRSLREVLLGNYRIVHRVTGDLVEILTVRHAARLLDPGRFE